MDWLSEYWDAIVLFIGAGLKLAQDHFKIKELVEDGNEMKENIKTLEAQNTLRVDTLARIETKVDHLVKMVDGNMEDIKKIHQRK